MVKINEISGAGPIAVSTGTINMIVRKGYTRRIMSGGQYGFGVNSC